MKATVLTTAKIFKNSSIGNFGIENFNLLSVKIKY